MIKCKKFNFIIDLNIKDPKRSKAIKSIQGIKTISHPQNVVMQFETIRHLRVSGGRAGQIFSTSVDVINARCLMMPISQYVKKLCIERLQRKAELT